jgi:hypothetical protein
MEALRQAYRFLRRHRRTIGFVAGAGAAAVAVWRVKRVLDEYKRLIKEHDVARIDHHRCVSELGWWGGRKEGGKEGRKGRSNVGGMRVCNVKTQDKELFMARPIPPPPDALALPRTLNHSHHRPGPPSDRLQMHMLRSRGECVPALLNFMQTLRKRVNEMVDVTSPVKALKARRHQLSKEEEQALWDQVKVSGAYVRWIWIWHRGGGWGFVGGGLLALERGGGGGGPQLRVVSFIH